MNKNNQLYLILFFMFSSIATTDFAYASETIRTKKNKPLTFASYNIRNFDHDPRSGVETNKVELAKILRTFDFDLLAIQEVVAKDTFESFFSDNFPKLNYKLSDCGGRGHQKLGFIYNPERLKLISFIEEPRIAVNSDCHSGIRPGVFGIFETKSKIKIVAVSLHLKAGGMQENDDMRYTQIMVLHDILKEYRTQGYKNFVIMGDLNTTDYIKKAKNYARFVEFVKVNDLVDSAEAMACTAYWSGGVSDGKEHSSILDHVLVSNKLLGKAKKPKIFVHSHCEQVACAATPAINLGESYRGVSDHCPVTFSLE
jgi:endonuclease/exonuclease/phosphatase family metal-dependent hydrolase